MVVEVGLLVVVSESGDSWAWATGVPAVNVVWSEWIEVYGVVGLGSSLLFNTLDRLIGGRSEAGEKESSRR